MPGLAQLIQWELVLFVLALAGIVALQLLTGQINTGGLFYGRISGRKHGEDYYFSPERVQLLVFTLGAALYYLTQVLSNPQPGTFPPVPDAWQFIDRAGDGTLADTAAALADASLFVGHDSGPLHVAGALGVPVIGIFAPGEPQRTFPQGVGRSRMLARPSPANIGAADIIAEIDAL